MPPFNIVIPPAGAVAVADFEAEADKALAAYRESAGESIPEEQFQQVIHLVDAAKQMVAAGLVGKGGVYAVLGGNANPDHVRAELRLESLVSIGIYQRPVPPTAQKTSRKSGGGRNG